MIAAPVRTSVETVTFELGVHVATRAECTIVLKGPEVQGPPAQRFAFNSRRQESPTADGRNQDGGSQACCDGTCYRD